MGKPPEVAATAINAFLTKLNTADKQGKKFQDALKALGLNAIDVKLAIKNDPQKVIMTILNRIKQFDKQTQMSILTDMFGAEYSDDIALLVAGLNNYKKALNLVSKEENYHNSMQKEFENRSKTTANQLQLLGNALNRIAIDLGSVVLPVLKTFADLGVKISNAIANFNQEFPILGKVITYAAVGLGTFAVVGAGVGYILTFISGGFTRLRIALTFLSKAVRFNKIEILLLDKAQKLYNKTALFTKANLIGLKNILSSFSLKTYLTKVKIISLTIAKKTWAFTTIFLSKSLNLLGKSLLFIGAKLKTAGIYAYNVALKTLNFTARLTSNALKFAGRSLLWLTRVMLTNPIGIAITAIAAGAYLIYSNWDKLKNWFSSFWGSVKNKFSVGVKFITAIFLSPINTIQNLWNKLLGWISKKIEYISSIGSKIKKFFGFGEDEEKKLTLKPVVEEVKPIVTATALTTATAQPTTQFKPIEPVKPTNLQLKPIEPVSIKPLNNQYTNNQYTNNQYSNLQYTININITGTNPNEIIDKIKVILPHLIEEIEENKQQRALSDIV